MRQCLHVYPSPPQWINFFLEILLILCTSSVYEQYVFDVLGQIILDEMLLSLSPHL